MEFKRVQPWLIAAAVPVIVAGLSTLYLECKNSFERQHYSAPERAPKDNLPKQQTQRIPENDKWWAEKLKESQHYFDNKRAKEELSKREQREQTAVYTERLVKALNYENFSPEQKEAFDKAMRIEDQAQRESALDKLLEAVELPE